MRKYALLALLALLPPFLSAARLTRRDGSAVYGRFISGSPQAAVVQDATVQDFRLRAPLRLREVRE